MSHPDCGMPLAVMITLDEQEETIVHSLRPLKEVLPQGAFHGSGAEQGPLIAMTDDSSTERNSLIHDYFSTPSAKTDVVT